jgi:hypothetical protein
VHLHRKSNQKQYVFALGIDPVPDRKPLVFSMSLLIFYGLKSDATTGSNLDANQQGCLRVAFFVPEIEYGQTTSG